MPAAALPTPALCVDVDLLEANVERMAAFFRGRPGALRPHLKADETPAAASVLFPSDAHTTRATADGFRTRPDERLRLRPSHVDPTVDLHDRPYAVRGYPT